MKADASLMKKMNKKTIRNQLRACETATKPEISSMVGLSVVTVGALISEMVASGEVLENGVIPSGGGRPSMQYRYHYGFKKMAVIFGHQKDDRNYLHVWVTDLSGACLWKKDGYYDTVTVASFEGALDEAFSIYRDIRLIAFGLPGVASEDVITINDYKEIVGPEFLTHYKTRYQVPVLFENDVNAMTYGFYHANRHALSESAVGIYFPRIYLPGAGFVLNGRIYYGTQRFSGEMGVIPAPIPWEKLDYGKEEQVMENIKSLLCIFSCILAPSIFVLYGDFIGKGMEGRLKEYTEKLLDGKFTVNLQVSESMEEDYAAGMVRLALEALDEMDE